MLPHAVTAAAQAAAIRRDRAPVPARSMFVIMPFDARPARPVPPPGPACDAWIMNGLLQDLAGIVGEKHRAH